MKRRDTEGDAPFLAAILAAPDEDAPRLVYADRLLERGDVRGEILVTQLAVARLPRRSEAWRRARAREHELLRSLPPPPHPRSWLSDWQRGLPTALSASPSVMRRHRASFDGLPLQRVTLMAIESRAPVTARLGDLAFARASFANLREIRLTNDGSVIALEVGRLPELDPKDTTPAWPLGELPHESVRDAVVSLNLRAHYTAELIERYRSEPLPNLAALELWIHDLDAIAALVARPTLRRLDLQGHYDKRAAASRLARSGVLAQLDALAAEVHLDVELADALAVTRLEALTLSHQADDPALVRLVASDFAARMKRLSLVFGGPSWEASVGAHAGAWVGGAHLPVLEKLHLGHLTLDATVAGLRAPELLELTLERCLLDAAGLDALVAHPELDALYRPVFNQCAMGPAGRDAVRRRWPDALID